MYGVLGLLASALLSAETFNEGQQQPASATQMQRAIEEFRHQTKLLGLRADSPRRAQRANGGAVSSRFHGRIYHNLRNDLLDAVPHEVTQNGGSKNLLRRNQFGLNLSGPVWLPRLYDGGRRTFFSVSYEGVRERIGRSYLRTIAATPERSGDFSQTVDSAGEPLPIYDPASTRLNPAFNAALPVSKENLQYLRDPFPGNVIPTRRLDAIALDAVGLYPVANTNVGPFLRNNYFVQSPETNTANGIIVRIDHTLRERHRLNTGITISNGFGGTAKYFPTAADPSSPNRDFRNRRLSVEHVFTSSSQSVNTITLDVASDIVQNTAETTPFASRLGLSTSGANVFPSFRISPYLSMGAANARSRNARNTYSVSDSFSHRMGRHNFRTSGSIVLYQVNTFVPQFPAGSYRFDAGLTSLPGITNTGHAFASFLLGMAEFAEISLVDSPSYFRRTRYTLTSRDQYEVRPGLTLSLGANLEINTPRVEKYNRQSTIDFSALNPVNGRAGALVAAGRNGLGRTLQPMVAVLEPSASITWNPGGNAHRVFRASYSRSYSAVPIYTAQFGTQGFNGYATLFSPNVQLEPALVLSRGLPVLPGLPDLRLESANDTIADYIHPSDDIPTYQSASVSIEQQLPGASVLTFGVYQSGAKNLLLSNNNVNLNAIHPSALAFRDQLNNEQFRRALRPFPHYLGFDLYSSYPAGRYERNAAYVRLEKRTSGGLSVNASYEYGKQMDDYSGPYGRQDFFNARNEWSLTAGNPLGRLSLSYIYELPIGANKPFLVYNDWRRILVDGWSVSGISTVNSGDPIYIRPQFNNTGGVLTTLNADVVLGVEPQAANQGPDQWFNPAAFAHPADFTLGNASRTHPSLRNPGGQNHDLSLSKRFVIGPERTLEFTASGFNFVNHANWNDPDNVIGAADAPNVNAGKIIGSRGGRIVQLGLRLSF